MKLNNPKAQFYVPDQVPINEALHRTTHLAVAAHQDDIEIMAYDGILTCYQKKDLWFTGVVVTNGSGSARDGKYKNYTDEEMITIRRLEQKNAAKIGKYGSLALLDYSSRDTKDPQNEAIVDELAQLIKLSKPEVLYTHNLADKHDTHIGVATKVIQAIRKLKIEDRPKKVYGCEVWRGLDWMLDSDKISFDVSGQPDLAEKLVQIFDSQIAGGKRYDLATLGRRRANATYSSSHTVDDSDSIIYAMDLTPLTLDDTMDIISYVESYIDKFKLDVLKNLQKNIR